MSDAAATVPEAVLLAGPTCAGKTALALELAEGFPAEIVSVDSAQVYRGLDVGTSKPSAAIRARVPHHLIDVCDPADRYSAGRFRRDALELSPGDPGSRPGSAAGRRHDAVFPSADAWHCALPEADPELRAPIDERARRVGWPALHAELDETPRSALCTTHADVLGATGAGKKAFILGMEGVEPLGSDLGLLRICYQLGVRVLGITHALRNYAADGAFFDPKRTGVAGGLSDFGVEVV